LSRQYEQPKPRENKKGLFNNSKFLVTSSLFLNLILFVCAFYFAWGVLNVNNTFLRASDEIVLSLILLGLIAINTGVLLVAKMRYRQMEKWDMDPETAALSRSAFEDRTHDEIHRASRYHYPLSLCLIDVTGNRAGKQPNKAKVAEFAVFMQQAIRQADFFGRYAQNKFCFLLPHTDIVQAEKFLARMVAQTEEHLDHSFIAGATCYHTGEKVLEFWDRAEMALDQAQREGTSPIRCMVGSDRESTFLQF